ncbi:DivIVA domain-containing protein [Ruminococcaceae bacterium OttesenSCG-928-L11]|nr:DivIVA domain-containing protein [Ruminococcaceae bacterium OttesenSCG-928-L11]
MTPKEIHSKQFSKGMNGYKTDEVSLYLGEVADYLRSVIRERDELLEKIGVLAEKMEEYRADEDSLRAALIGAQKLGDSVVREAKAKAQAIIDEARRKADTISEDAKRSIEVESYTLEKKKLEAAKFKSQLLAMYKQHIDYINALPYDEDKMPPLSAPAPVTRQPEPRQQQPEEQDVIEVVLDYDDGLEEDSSLEFPQRKPIIDKDDLRFGEKFEIKRDE